MYIYSIVLQFPVFCKSLSNGFFARTGTDEWFWELEEKMKRSIGDPGGYLDYHYSGQRRADTLLAGGYQPWDLPPLAGVSRQQQALFGVSLMPMAELCIRAQQWVPP